MGTYTRRRLLTAATTLIGGVAGCLGSRTVSRSSESSTERSGRGIPEQAATDPPVLFRRGDADRPPIRFVDEDDDGDGNGTDGPPWQHDHYTGTKVIDNAATADRLAVDSDASDRAESTDLSTFRSETDFENETLYLENRRLRQCYRLSLCYISWDTGIETDYGRLLRPYDEPCAVDTRVFESRLIRLPVALDADEINRFGSSTSSSRCRLERRRAEGNRTSRSNGSRPSTDSGAGTSTDSGERSSIENGSGASNRSDSGASNGSSSGIPNGSDQP